MGKQVFSWRGTQSPEATKKSVIRLVKKPPVTSSLRIMYIMHYPLMTPGPEGMDYHPRTTEQEGVLQINNEFSVSFYQRGN